MQPDKEGFLYPVIDVDKCKECSLCEKACPVLNEVNCMIMIQLLLHMLYVLRILFVNAVLLEVLSLYWLCCL